MIITIVSAVLKKNDFCRIFSGKKMRSYGLKLLLAIICAFALSTAALSYIFSCLFPDAFSTTTGPTKKRECQEYEHKFSMATTHESVQCSRCNRSVYEGAICRNCGKSAVEIFKKEHSCFISGIGEVIYKSSGRGHLPPPNHFSDDKLW